MVYRNPISGIYQIRNLCNSKVYIGCSASVQARWNTHRTQLRRQLHRNLHLQGAWNEYGEAAFSFEILELVEPEKLLEREQYWFESTQCFNPDFGYNQNPFAGTTKGGRHRPASEERKRKIGDANRGRKHSEEQNRKHSEMVRGVPKPPRTNEHLQRLSAANKGEGKPWVRVNWAIVREIRAEFPCLFAVHGKQKAKYILAQRYGISIPTIHDIATYRTWIED